MSWFSCGRLKISNWSISLARLGECSKSKLTHLRGYIFLIFMYFHGVIWVQSPSFNNGYANLDIIYYVAKNFDVFLVIFCPEGNLLWLCWHNTFVTLTADVLIISTYSQLHLPISSLMDQNFFGRCSLPHFLNTCLLLKDHAWYALAILSKSLKKSTFKLEFFFYFSSKISSILSILQIWETYKLNFYDNMQTSNKIWSVFMILQEKSFYQKILQKIWPGH